MLILILGANNLCNSLASTLCSEGHDICVISEHRQSLEHLRQFVDCQTVVGCPSHPHILKRANANEAEMIIAATKNDEMNMVSCQVAHSLYKVPKKIAFISNAHYLAKDDLFGNINMPIDTLISLEQIISEQLSELITFSNGHLKKQIANSDFYLVIATVASPEEFGINIQKSQTAILFRGQEQIEFGLETELKENDQIIFICHKSEIKKITQKKQGLKAENNKIVIGADIGVADTFLGANDGTYIKIIEPEHNNCKQLAENHPQATILNGHITEYDLLNSENMQKTNIFCAITNDDEDNIMAALQAKELGAKTTIAMIQNQHYKKMLLKSTIDYILDPSDRVLAKMKASCIKNVHRIPNRKDLIVEASTNFDIDIKALKDFIIIACIDNEIIYPADKIPRNTSILLLIPEISYLEKVCNAIQNTTTPRVE